MAPKTYRKVLFFVLMIACHLSVSCMPCFCEQTISKGVLIEGMDVGGMTLQEAQALVEDRIDQMGETAVSFTLDEHSYTTTLNDMGFHWTNPTIFDEIMTLGTQGNVVERYKAKKDLEEDNREFTLSYEVDPEQIKNFTAAFSELNTEPVNAVIYTTDELTPGVDGGTEGIEVKTEEAAKLLLDAVSSWDAQSPISLEIPVKRTQPEVPYESLAQIKDVLGSATTDFSFSSYQRWVNVENGCAKISGTLLYPGDYFSVTAAVTPFTPENGYELAPSYEENQVVNSYGGGICQVSTTLYNAVLKAEMEVTARSNHSMVVTYVDLSKDAAIAEGALDMCFVNSLEYPVYIIGYCSGGLITFTIYGHETRPANRRLEFVSVTTGVMEPSGAGLVANPSQAVGYVNQTQAPHTGYTAELWKNIYIDEQLVDSVQINSSYYNAVGTIYDIGVASSNAALSQAMYSAIGSGSLNNVYAVINSMNQIGSEAQSETSAQGQTPQTSAQENAGGEQAGSADIIILDNGG
ncbi:MAG: VanW family protein [Lachnospiraceae bacterium]|nr:VanW family protein [Lachnospiraceae bacterium]